MNDCDTKIIQRFLSTILPWEAAYTHAGLSYLALRNDDNWNLLKGRLFLHTAPSKIPRTQFQTNNVKAGYFLLSEINLSYRDLLSQLVSSGQINTPAGDFTFPLRSDSQIAPYFVPFHQEGIRTGNRLPVLSLFGAEWHSYVQQPDIDWELKAASQPFDSINELSAEYFLGGSFNDQRSVVEIIATHVTEIVFSSKVEGDEAEPTVLLAKPLDIKKCQIGYRVFIHGSVVTRGSISGNDISWSEENEYYYRGVSQVKIPRGAALHCVASYNEFAQHQGWIADPKNIQNALRAALEENDDKLEVLRDYLFEEQRSRRESRDFEFGVAWLMWMLGFSVAQAGGTSRTSDAADIIATTPQGNIVIVECTIGLLKAEHKLAKLVERAEALRKRLHSCGHTHLKLLPVIVTAKTEDEVRADLEQAQKLGVVVVTKETLADAFQKTIAPADADTIFAQALASIQQHQGKLGFLPTGS